MQKLKEFFQANYKKPAFWIIAAIVIVGGWFIVKNIKNKKK